ncbi:hypothetical protein ABIC02_007497 [Bradyrhizobium sp. RT5a]
MLADATNLGPNGWPARPGITAHQIGRMRTFMSDPRQIVPRKHASPMNTPGIRIREYGTEQPRRPMAHSSARATEPPNVATSICITAVSPDQNSSAIFPIRMATLAFSPSVRPNMLRALFVSGPVNNTRLLRLIEQEIPKLVA